VRAAAAIAVALVGVRGDELVRTLERLLDDPDPDVRVHASAAAAHAREEARPLLPRLERLRGDAEPRVAVAAVAASDVLNGREPPKPPGRVSQPA
jgi:HEAT repeat protein